MKYYSEFILLQDSEFPITVLMNAVFTKLHKSLYDLKATDIGISFPKANITLSNVLRLHSTQARLEELMQLNWLGGMSGYCQLSGIQVVPDAVQYRTVSRKQSTMSQAKLNRLIKRGSITEGEIKQYRAKMFSKGLEEPYVELMSGSNGHKHRRYIEFGPLQNTPVSGKFDQFGLSKTATVPWF